jgi:hypothetical protein
MSQNSNHPDQKRQSNRKPADLTSSSPEKDSLTVKDAAPEADFLPEPPSQEEALAPATERTAALAVLGLKASANAYAIDNRFWQLTKRYRSENNKAKLDEVTVAYDIASGRAQAERAEQMEIQQSRKLLGKTASQWKVHFYYAWWKYLALVVSLLICTVLVRQIFFTEDYDLKVVSLGHFTMNNTFVTNTAKNELEYKNPYVVYADLILPESEPQTTSTLNGPATAASFLSLRPDVLVFDEITMTYYFPYLNPMDNFYETMIETLPKAVMDEFEPVYWSEAEYNELTFDEDDGSSEDVAFTSPVDNEPMIYGLMTRDPDLIKALGFNNLRENEEPTLVFCIANTSSDMMKAEEFITWIIRNRSIIIKEYLESEKSNP